MKDKIYLLLSSAIPVIYRLLVVYIASRVFNSSHSSIFVNDFSVSIAMSLFFGMGISSYCLIKSATEPNKCYLFTIHSLNIVFLPFLLILVFVLSCLDYIINWGGVLIITVSFVIQMILKHFLLGRKLYFDSAKLELFSLSIFLLSVFCFHNEYEYYYYIVCFSILIPSIPYTLYKMKMENYLCEFFKSGDYFYVLNTSASNFISTGFSFLIPSYFYHYLDKTLVTQMSIVQQISSFVTFLTKNISLYFLGVLPGKKDVANQYRKFSRLNIIVLLSSFVFVLAFYVAYYHVYNPDLYFLICSMMVFLGIVTSQLSLPSSNILMLSNNTFHLLLANLYYISISMVGLVLVYFMSFYFKGNVYYLAICVYLFMFFGQVAKSISIVLCSKELIRENKVEFK